MSKLKHIQVVVGGKYYSSVSSYSYFARKMDAEKTLRSRGYKFNKKDKLFLNDKLERWARIDKQPLHHEAIAEECD